MILLFPGYYFGFQESLVSGQHLGNLLQNEGRGSDIYLSLCLAEIRNWFLIEYMVMECARVWMIWTKCMHINPFVIVVLYIVLWY